MKALLCGRFGPPEELEVAEVEPPPLHEREVRIAVHAAGLNFADTLMIAGRYQLKPAFPFSPGMEIAGVVCETGPGATRWRVGDRVMSTCVYGGFAQERCMPQDKVYPVPDEVSFDVAASFPITYGTTYHALTRRAALAPGEWLLVHGAGSGVGLNAVELGTRLGARVIACAGSAAKLEVARRYGAEALVDVSQGPFRDRVMQLTAGHGADVVFDPVGGDVFDESMRCIAWEGRLLVVGFASGRIPQVPANKVLLRECQIVGVNTAHVIEQRPDEYRESFATMMRWTVEGRLRPLVSAVYPLEEVPRAMAALTSRSLTGKAVIRLR